MDVTRLSPNFLPGLKGKHIKRVIDLPARNLKAYMCHSDSQIRIYKNDASEEPILIFNNHVSPTMSYRHVFLFHLTEDVMCSMHVGGNVISWLAGSGDVLETHNVDGSKVLIKLNATRLAVMLDSGAILVLEHNQGRHIHEILEISIRTRNIIDIQGNGSILALVRQNGMAEIWDCNTGTRRHTFRVDKSTDYVELSQEFIAFASREDGILCLHENTGSYTRLDAVDFTLHLPGGRTYPRLPTIQNILFISPTLLLVTSTIGVYFLRLPSLEIDSCFEFGSAELQGKATSLDILRDGNIYVAGSEGLFSTFQAPGTFRFDMKKFVGRLYEEPAPPTADLVASCIPSSNDAVSDDVSGSQKRTRKDFEGSEKKGGWEQIAKMINPEEELGKQISGMGRKQLETWKVVGDLRTQKEEVIVLKEAAAALKEEIQLLRENNKTEAAAQKKATNMLVLGIQASKATTAGLKKEITQMTENYKAKEAAMKEAMNKYVIYIEASKKAAAAQKEEFRQMREKSKTEAAAQNKATTTLITTYQAQLSMVEDMEERANFKSEPQIGDIEKEKKELKLLDQEVRKLLENLNVQKHELKNIQEQFNMEKTRTESQKEAINKAIEDFKVQKETFQKILENSNAELKAKNEEILKMKEQSDAQKAEIRNLQHRLKLVEVVIINQNK